MWWVYGIAMLLLNWILAYLFDKNLSFYFNASFGPGLTNRVVIILTNFHNALLKRLFKFTGKRILVIVTLCFAVILQEGHHHKARIFKTSQIVTTCIKTLFMHGWWKQAQADSQSGMGDILKIRTLSLKREIRYK